MKLIKKYMKKFLSFVIVLCVACTAIAQIVYEPVSTVKVGAFYYHILSDSTAELYENQDYCTPYPSGIVEVPATIEVGSRTYTVVKIGDLALNSCTIQSVVLPETIEEIGVQAFNGYAGDTIVLPNSLKRIGKGAFASSSRMVAIDIPANVEEIAFEPFVYSSIRQITVDSANTHFRVIGNALFSYDTSRLLCYPPTLGIENTFVVPSEVRSIDDGAFYGENSIAHITLNEGLLRIGSRAFGSRLEGITIPASVRFIDGVLQENSQSTFQLAVDAANTHYKCVDNMLMSMDGDTLLMIVGASGHVTIPNGVTVLGTSVLAENYRVSQIDVPEGVTTIGVDALFGCKATINLPQSLQKIDTNAFYGTTKVKDLYLPNLETVGPGAFQNSKLESLLAPRLKYVGNSAFSTYKLKNIRWGNLLEVVEHYAFSGAPLDSIQPLPSTLSKVGYKAFPAVGKVVFNGSADTIGHNAIKSDIVRFKSATPPVFIGTSIQADTIYVPCNAGDAYLAALGNAEEYNVVEENCDSVDIALITPRVTPFNIAPNPAHGEVTVSLPEGLSSFHARLVLRDATGREVRSMEASNPTVKMPLQGLAQGTYLLTLMTDKGSSTQKLVVE